MRLLLITQDFPPDVGGTQTYAYELACRLADRCEDFAVIAPSLPDTDAVDAAMPFEVVRVRASYDSLSIKAVPTLLRMARTRGFDAAFHVQWSTAVGSLLARPWGGARLIFVAAHGRELLLEPWARLSILGSVFGGVRRHVLRRVTGLFPVSRYTGILLKQHGVPSERITVVGNGTDPAYFHPMDSRPLRRELSLNQHHVVLTVSRLVSRKGIDTVLRALPQVLSEMPNVYYLIAGSGPDQERLEALTHELHLTDQVRFLGIIPRDKLCAYYNACDVFAMPSREDGPHVEGFGIAFLEANACGKPVIGARSGGIPDAVRDGETGLLVEPDDEEELATALLRLLRDPEYATRLGNNGKRRVEQEATWDHVANHLYEAIARHL